MVKSRTSDDSLKWRVIALAFSGLLVLGGLIFSLVTGEWIALLSASGLAILPLGVFVGRKR